MPKEYRPPQTREEALERVEQVRRLLDERTKTVGESGTSQDMVSLQVLRDVMTGNVPIDVEIPRGGGATLPQAIARGIRHGKDTTMKTTNASPAAPNIVELQKEAWGDVRDGNVPNDVEIPWDRASLPLSFDPGRSGDPDSFFNDAGMMEPTELKRLASDARNAPYLRTRRENAETKAQFMALR